MAKYDPLTPWLLAAGDRPVEASFAELDAVVGGLAPTARTNRTWWGNSVGGARPQASAWFAARRVVEMVNLTAGRVRFSAPFASAEEARQTVRRGPQSSSPAAKSPVGVATGSGSVAVTFAWLPEGAVTAGPDGKLLFPRVPSEAAVYRFLLEGLSEDALYIGETDNLARRAANYRNPQPRQQTSYRMNGILTAHLGLGGSVRLEAVVTAELRLDYSETRADLGLKPVRLLIENAALLQAMADGRNRILYL